MGGSSSSFLDSHLRYARNLGNVNYGAQYEPEKRIIERPITKLDKRQQWEIIFNDTDKKIFKLRSIENNSYLYLGQEPNEGLPEFNTIYLDNDNYKYDPAFAGISTTEIANKTDFSFISSFGTQLDIVDKHIINMKTNNEKESNLPSIKASRVRLTTKPNQYLNIFGVFIYGPNKNVLNTNPNYAYSSSNYQNNYPASHAMNVVTLNLDRKIHDALQNKTVKGKRGGWNSSQVTQIYAHTDNDNSGVGGGAWWEYEFDEPVAISLIEIFGRTDCCPERLKNLRIDLYNDEESRTKVIWTDSFGEVNYDAHKVIKITNK